MAELGVAASIIAIIQITQTTLKFLRDARDARQEPRHLVAEVSSLRGVLETLNDQARDLDHDDSWPSTLKLLEDPLKKIKDILTKLNHGLQSAGFRRLGRAVAWPFQKEEYKNIISGIERQKTIILLALQNDQIGLSRAIQGQVENLATGIQEITEGVISIRKFQTVFERQHSNEELRRILDWISPLEFWSKQSTVYGQRQPGTGTWFLENPTFQSWCKGEFIELWCPGIAGAGKTIVSSIVINHLEHQLKDKAALAWIYCDYNEQQQQDTSSLVSSILRQLVQKDSEIMDGIRDLYIAGRGRPSLTDFSRLLGLQIERFNEVFIVIDALDECADEDIREELVEALRLPSVHLLVTSRPLPSIGAFFADAPLLEIKARDFDIKNYLNDRILTEKRLVRLVKTDVSLKMTIMNTVTEKAQGMFLLACLHLDSISSAQNTRALKQILQDLPKTYDPTYDNAMQRIEDQEESAREIAFKVLTWISYAARPVSVSELQHALSVQAGDKDFDPDGVTDADLLISLCAGLIEIAPLSVALFAPRFGQITKNGNPDEPLGPTLRWIHYTTQDYFQRVRRHRFPNGPGELARTCLCYLSYDAFQEALTEQQEAVQRHLRYPFLKYASTYWPRHVRDESTEALTEFIVQVLKQEGRRRSIYSSWHRHLFWDNSATFDDENVTALQVAAKFGLEDVAELLLDGGHDVDEECSGTTALWLAVENMHSAVTKLLLAHGADPNAKASATGGKLVARNYSFRRPLHIASDRNSTDIVESLLEHGANVHVQVYEGTALHIAANRGHLSIAQMLLRAGSNPMITNYEKNTPLGEARDAGRSEVLKVLLPLWSPMDYRTVDAQRKSFIDWVEEFELDTEFIFNFVQTRTHDNKSTLHLSAEEGNLPDVESLLRWGSDMESQDDSGATPMHYAAENGHLEVVMLLIEAGSNPRTRDKKARTPLDRAINNSHSDVEVVLSDYDKRYAQNKPLSNRPLKPGLWMDTIVHETKSKNPPTDVFAQRSGITLLHRAAKCGNIDFVSKWLEAGYELTPRDKIGKTPLHYVVLTDHVSTADLLIARMSELEIQDHNGMTPFDYALRRLLAQWKSEPWSVPIKEEPVKDPAIFSICIKLLTSRLQDGRGITGGLENREKIYNKTPIIQEGEKVYVQRVRFLLDCGADPSAGDSSGTTALHYAIQNNAPIELVQMLVDAGADLGPDNWKRTPLDKAEERGNVKVCDLLRAKGGKPYRDITKSSLGDGKILTRIENPPSAQ